MPTDIGRLPLKVFEIHKRTERIYRAFPARPTFDKVFGKNWEKAQEIVFASVDGYQPSIPVMKFLSHDASLAFAHGDGTPFTLINTLQDNETVQLGPFYLVWDNINSTPLLEANASDMPWQVKRVERRFVAPFPNMSLPRACIRKGTAGVHAFYPLPALSPWLGTA